MAPSTACRGTSAACRCLLSAVHVRWFVVGGLCLGCASTEPPVLQDEVSHVEVLGHDDGEPPLVPPVASSSAPWVWAETARAQNSCIVGCPSPIDGADARLPGIDAPTVDQPRDQVFRAWPSDGNLIAARLEPADRPWESALAIDGPRTARALRCGAVVFVVFGAAGDPAFGSWLLDPNDGTTIDHRAVPLTSGARLAAPPQLVCRDRGGIIVSTKQALIDGAQLGVYELDDAGRTTGQRTLDGHLADLDASPVEPPVGPRITGADRSYHFTRGRSGKTKPWWLHATRRDGQTWRHELGDPEAPIGLSSPTYYTEVRRRPGDPDLVVLEDGERIVVMFERRLFALDADTGKVLWRADLGGFDHLQQRLVGPDSLGLRGCSRCAFPRPEAWLDGEHVVFVLSSSLEHFINVVDAHTGEVVARRVID